MNAEQTAAAPSSGWWSGFANMFRKESYEWWGTRRWLAHALVWLVVCNALPALLLATLPALSAAGPGGAPAIDPLDAAMNIFVMAALTGVGLGAALVAQGQVIDELQQGTAEWVLSKPVARSAFLLAKMAASGAAMLALMVALPGAALLLLLLPYGGGPLTPSRFLLVEGLVALNALFSLALTFLVATLTGSRAAAVGAAAASTFGGPALVQFFPALAGFTPWGLSIWARMIISGAPLEGALLAPLAVTALLSLGAVALTVRFFARAEL